MQTAKASRLPALHSPVCCGESRRKEEADLREFLRSMPGPQSTLPTQEPQSLLSFWHLPVPLHLPSTELGLVEGSLQDSPGLALEEWRAWKEGIQIQSRKECLGACWGAELHRSKEERRGEPWMGSERTPTPTLQRHPNTSQSPAPPCSPLQVLRPLLVFPTSKHPPHSHPSPTGLMGSEKA